MLDHITSYEVGSFIVVYIIVYSFDNILLNVTYVYTREEFLRLLCTSLCLYICIRECSALLTEY